MKVALFKKSITPIGKTECMLSFDRFQQFLECPQAMSLSSMSQPLKNLLGRPFYRITVFFLFLNQL